MRKQRAIDKLKIEIFDLMRAEEKIGLELQKIRNEIAKRLQRLTEHENNGRQSRAQV